MKVYRPSHPEYRTEIKLAFNRYQKDLIFYEAVVKISRTVLIYQRGNQNPYTEEEQKLQWQKEEGEKR